MELWIRSQDKEKLVRTDSIRYMDMSNDYDKETHSIWNKSIGVLGTYKTKERALEVLDEIQNILKPYYVIDKNSIKEENMKTTDTGMVFVDYSANARIEQLSTYVYEMPED